MKRLLLFAFLSLIGNMEVIAQTDEQDFQFIIVSPESIAGSYPWRGTTDFGGVVQADFCSEIVWAGGVDELACNPLSSDLSGKIALVRRGDCFFSTKIYEAQEAGAIAVIVANHNQDSNIGLEGVTGMAAGDDLAQEVTIPAIFVSYNTGESLKSALANGPVEACFKLPTFDLAFGPYSYATPLSQVVPLDNVSVRIINRNEENYDNLDVTLEVFEPDGNVVTFTESNPVGAGGEVDFFFNGYTPQQKGIYNMRFTSGLDGSVLERVFEITDYTWALDDGNIDRWAGPTDELFEASGFFYQHGNLVLTGNGGVATHITFGIGNGEEVFSGDPTADLIIFAIYNADKDNDDEIDEFTSFIDLGDPLEIGFYEIKGNETIENLITAPFDSPVMLEPNGIYYVSIAYDGVDAGLGVCPGFAGTARIPYLNFPTTPLQLDQLYSGWANTTVVTRLHLEGFTSDVKEFKVLDQAQLLIFENPVVQNQLQYRLTLEAPSERVDVRLRNLEGKLLDQKVFSNVLSLDSEIQVSHLPGGVYFLNVHTDEGFLSRKIVISR